MTLQEGTQVWLKIGSPAMTVKSRTKRNTYFCTWIVGNEINEYEFSLEDLTTEDPSKPLPLRREKRKTIFAGLF